MPPKAIRKNFTTASPGEKLPVSTAAMAKLKATRPEASFNNDSPSRICAILEGSGELAVIADTATGSVGDRIAASEPCRHGDSRDQPVNKQANTENSHHHQAYRQR